MINILFLLMFISALFSIIIILQYGESRKIKRRMKLMENTRNTLYYVAEEITKLNKPEEVYELILDSAVSLIPYATKGSILMLEEDGMFHFRALKGYSDGLQTLALKKEEAFLYNINNFKETAIIKNPLRFNEGVVNSKKIEEMKSMEVLNITCTLCSPIYLEEKFIGLINVDSSVRGRIFTKEDINLMNHIKSELQLALKNSVVQNKLRYMANFDELTGLFNRRYFKNIFNKELQRIRRYKSEGCLALIDIDDFKQINDTYGHNMGDKALKFFSDILRENIRNTDIYARMSGDEFVILFINCNYQNAKQRMEYLREILKERYLGNLNISISYGVCSIDADSDLTPDDIFGIADREMYRDKGNKKSR